MVGIGNGLFGWYLAGLDSVFASDVRVDSGPETRFDRPHIPEVPGRKSEPGQDSPVVAVAQR